MSSYILDVWFKSKFNIWAFLLKARCIVCSQEDPFIRTALLFLSHNGSSVCVTWRGGPVLTLNPGGVGQDKAKPVWKSVDHLRSHKKTSPFNKLFLMTHFQSVLQKWKLKRNTSPCFSPVFRMKSVEFQDVCWQVCQLNFDLKRLAI